MTEAARMVNSNFLIPLICFLVMGMVFLAGCSNLNPAVSPAPGLAITSGSGKSISPVCITSVPGKLSESPDFASHFTATELLTRPTNSSVTISLIPKEDSELFFEFGTSTGSYSCQTTEVNVKAGSPLNSTIRGLIPDSHYYYRTCYKAAGQYRLSMRP